MYVQAVVITQKSLIFVIDEAVLRKRISELQAYRRLGLCTASDIDKYEHDLAKRVRKLADSSIICPHICVDTSQGRSSRL